MEENNNKNSDITFKVNIEKVKIKIKKYFISLFNIDEPAKFLLNVNKYCYNIVIAISIILLIYFFFKCLFGYYYFRKFALIILFLSPIILFVVKYVFALYIVILDWINASTEYYKSQNKKD